MLNIFYLTKYVNILNDRHATFLTTDPLSGIHCIYLDFPQKYPRIFFGFSVGQGSLDVFFYPWSFYGRI